MFYATANVLLQSAVAYFEGGNFNPVKAARREVPDEVDAPGPEHTGLATGLVN